MHFDLCTIDWTAVGSIVTFVAMIIAYWTIHLSNKQNKANQKFQLLLIQYEIEQKRLDELVECIMDIHDSIQPAIALDLAQKLDSGILTPSDQSKIDSIGAKDQFYSNKLTILCLKYNKRKTVKNVLVCLGRLRDVYGELIRDVSVLNLYKSNKKYFQNILDNMIENMIRLSKECDPQCGKFIDEILCKETHDLDKALELMTLFSAVASSYIIDGKHGFERLLYDFVEKEQRRIDGMLNQ